VPSLVLNGRTFHLREGSFAVEMASTPGAKTAGEVVFVGMRLPLLGFLLAKATHAPHAVGVYELGVIRDAVAPEPIMTMGDLPT
jgi:hypothetical protein